MTASPSAWGIKTPPEGIDPIPAHRCHSHPSLATVTAGTPSVLAGPRQDTSSGWWQGWVAVAVLLSPPHSHGHRIRVGNTAASPRETSGSSLSALPLQSAARSKVSIDG